MTIPENVVAALARGDFYEFATQIQEGDLGGGGASGISGYSGYSGQDGAASASGYSGYSGVDGVSGISGYSGVDGAAGVSGIDGASGISGYSGVDGAEGASGIDGASGISGYSGLDGISGFSGVDGASGISGYSGSSGVDGITGDKYTTASTTSLTIGTGAQTLTVETGLALALGQVVIVSYDVSNQMTGEITSYNCGTGQLDVDVSVVEGSGTYAAWVVALQGAPGPAGDSGYSGFSGQDGAAGTSGYSGTEGSMGNDGLSGFSGIDGASGISGYSGVDGTSGFSGVDGASGISGYSGVDGTEGASGISGYSGVDGTEGASGISGYSGVDGTVGADGASGISGYSGYSGFSGIDGESGISGYSGYTLNEHVQDTDTVLQASFGGPYIEQPLTDQTSYWAGTAGDKLGYSFVAEGNVNLESVSIPIRTWGAGPEDAIVSIFAADGSHFPTGGSLGSKTIPGASLPEWAPPAWQFTAFTFDTPIALTDGVEYVIVIQYGVNSVYAYDNNAFPQFHFVYDSGGGWQSDYDDWADALFTSATVVYTDDLVNDGTVKNNIIVDPGVTIDGRDVSVDGAKAHVQNTDRVLQAEVDLPAPQQLFGDTWMTDIYGIRCEAQTFVADKTGSLDSIDLWLGRQVSDDSGYADLECIITQATLDVIPKPDLLNPIGTPAVLAKTAIPFLGGPGSGATQLQFTFSDVPVVAGVTYAYVIRQVGGGGSSSYDYYAYSNQNANPDSYLPGRFWYSFDGDSWSHGGADDDMAFIVATSGTPGQTIVDVINGGILQRDLDANSLRVTNLGLAAAAGDALRRTNATNETELDKVCNLASSGYFYGSNGVNNSYQTVPLTPIQPAGAGRPFGDGLRTTAMQVGENVALGDVCYLKSDGKLWIANATTIATAPGLYLTTTTVLADASAEFLLLGSMDNAAWLTLTIGGLVYLSDVGTSGNTITQTAPTGTDKVVQILGIATQSRGIYFNPSLSMVELV